MVPRESSGKAKDKIKDLSELAAVLATIQSEEKRVVQCHGVFDLLHIGHIRHFEEAKKLGDVLVVTLTQDKDVNKGPHRPAFSEDLRAEAIAALDCVDYVAINKWPMAVEAIKLLRPDFYVKGSDYRQAKDDRTGGIGLEEEAVKAIGGELVFTDDIVFSSSNLINRHIPLFPKEVMDYLAYISGRYSAPDVIKYLDSAKDLKVLVVGEAIIDEYTYCEAIGKSSKEPMLAVKHLSMEKFAGGILAVGNHVANFCENVGMLTFIGSENSQEDFINTKVNPRIKKAFLRRSNSPTIVKRRFVDSYFFTKLLEVYEMNDGPLAEGDNRQFCAALDDMLPQYDLVIVVDFGHGMFSREAIDILCRKARFLALNVQANAGNLGYNTITKYSRADYICIAENEARLEARDRRGDLREIMVSILRQLGCERVVVTHGKQGCLGFSEKEGFFEAPALAGQVVDRVGAGDTLLSLSALCVAQGAPMEVVGFIGNAAGAQAVGTIGNRTPVEPVSLYKQIEALLK